MLLRDKRLTVMVDGHQLDYGLNNALRLKAISVLWTISLFPLPSSRPWKGWNMFLHIPV
jgi:hypothetical protein